MKILRPKYVIGLKIWLWNDNYLVLNFGNMGIPKSSGFLKNSF